MRDPLRQTIKTYRNRSFTGWSDFDALVALRPQILVNVFSTPGIGKSFWALNLMKRWTDPARNKRATGALYITLDTPLSTQAGRWSALHKRRPIEYISKAPIKNLKSKDRHRRGHAWVEWTEVPMSVEDLPELLKGIQEVNGSYPGLVIVDVVKDLLRESGYEEMATAFKLLKQYAMQAKITIVSLHHATKNNDPSKRLHLRDVEYSGDKTPDVVLGMYEPREDKVMLQVLKNRDGEGSPNGYVEIEYRIDWERGGEFYIPAFRRQFRD